MEEILRLKIKRTESATIEVVPVEDGIEILVLRKEAKRPKIEFHDERNIEILRAFCTSKKGIVDKGELKRFWEFYSPKMEDWKGKVDCNKLWSRWTETKPNNE